MHYLCTMLKTKQLHHNDIQDRVLMFGCGDNFMYGVNDKDELFNNTDAKNNKIDLSDGLYVYYNPLLSDKSGERKITFFIYEEDEGNKIQNKFEYNLPKDASIFNKDDILKTIIENINEVFPENQKSKDNQEKIKNEFFQFFIPCMEKDYKIDPRYLWKSTSSYKSSEISLNKRQQNLEKKYKARLKENFIEDQSKAVERRLAKLYSQSRIEQNALPQAFLTECKNIIQQYYEKYNLKRDNAYCYKQSKINNQQAKKITQHHSLYDQPNCCFSAG